MDKLHYFNVDFVSFIEVNSTVSALSSVCAQSKKKNSQKQKNSMTLIMHGYKINVKYVTLKKNAVVLTQFWVKYGQTQTLG